MTKVEIAHYEHILLLPQCFQKSSAAHAPIKRLYEGKSYITGIVILQVGFCYIDGLCVSEGATHTRDNCSVCDVNTNALDWSTQRRPGKLLYSFLVEKII